MKKLLGLRLLTISLVALCAVCSLLSACKGKGGEDAEAGKRGEPVLTHEIPVYDETTGTFSLVLKADSVEGASLLYYLIDGDSVIMKNDNGKFSGIQPLDDGYDVKLEVCWEDTVIERRFHILDFVVPAAPVEKIAPEELAKLINSKDKSKRESIDKYLSQGVIFNVTDSKMQPQMLSDAITLIDTGLWKSVEVVKLQYNDKNLITEITVRPIGEQAAEIDTEDEDYDY